jgi:hypothetical protein
MRLYLGYPIDRIEKREALAVTRMINDVREILPDLPCGVVVYDPGAAWLMNFFFKDPLAPTPRLANWVVRINEYALKMADVALWLLPKGVPTAGVWCEMQEFRKTSGQYPSSIIYTDDPAINRSLYVARCKPKIITKVNDLRVELESMSNTNRYSP